jgi:hypothetical protein
VCGLVLLLLGLPALCFPIVGIPFTILGIVMMVIGGRSADQPVQQNYYHQAYYPPPQPMLPPPPPVAPPKPGVYGQAQIPQQARRLRQNPDGTWS